MVKTCKGRSFHEIESPSTATAAGSCLQLQYTGSWCFVLKAKRSIKKGTNRSSKPRKVSGWSFQSLDRQVLRMPICLHILHSWEMLCMDCYRPLQAPIPSSTAKLERCAEWVPPILLIKTMLSSRSKIEALLASLTYIGLEG